MGYANVQKRQAEGDIRTLYKGTSKNINKKPALRTGLGDRDRIRTCDRPALSGMLYAAELIVKTKNPLKERV